MSQALSTRLAGSAEELLEIGQRDDRGEDIAAINERGV